MDERLTGPRISMPSSLFGWKDLLAESIVQVEIAVCLGLVLLAWSMARLLRRRSDVRTGFGRFALHLSFPILAWVLLGVGNFVMRHLGYAHAVFTVAGRLAFALIVIRSIELILRQVFARSGWLRGAERYLAIIVWTVVALDLIGVLPEVIEWFDSLAFHLGKQRISVWLLIQGVITIVSTMMLAMWVGELIEERVMRSRHLDSSVQAVIARVLRAVLTLVGVLVAMSLLGLDLTTLSVFSGALGVGIGLGMQKIASNYISGFIILLDRSIRLGNVISVGVERGEVKEITTRYTVLQAPTGVTVIVPNDTLISNVVQNETYADKNVRIAIKIQVGYATDIDRALQILIESAKVHERVLHDPEPAAFLVNFGENGIDLELGLWIYDPVQGSLGIRSLINREIWRRFKEEGIEIPFPQRDIRLLNAEVAIPAVAAG
ncbi:mechanosensitive ion channel domain-containing protein [Niveibacterium sp. SC-1]|uniref:mechanosensitive ion channel family protein n=1 Tax=Niveibacterium sp. SC-1 TaxID=3135646 RepID=UPI00311EF089